jgi:hypothetical protein
MADQNMPGACRTCSAVLCVAFLIFQDRRKEAKGKKIFFKEIKRKK